MRKMRFAKWIYSNATKKKSQINGRRGKKSVQNSSIHWRSKHGGCTFSYTYTYRQNSTRVYPRYKQQLFTCWVNTIIICCFCFAIFSSLFTSCFAAYSLFHHTSHETATTFMYDTNENNKNLKNNNNYMQKWKWVKKTTPEPEINVRCCAVQAAAQPHWDVGNRDKCFIKHMNWCMRLVDVTIVSNRI